MFCTISTDHTTEDRDVPQLRPISMAPTNLDRRSTQSRLRIAADAAISTIGLANLWISTLLLLCSPNRDEPWILCIPALRQLFAARLHAAHRLQQLQHLIAAA